MRLQLNIQNNSKQPDVLKMIYFRAIFKTIFPFVKFCPKLNFSIITQKLNFGENFAKRQIILKITHEYNISKTSSCFESSYT